MRAYGAAPAAPRPRAPLCLFRQTIIAVCRRQLSGDPEQEYSPTYRRGLITALSESNRSCIARNSTFTYKGRAVDVRQVGRDLGVRYVLEGSIRKAGTRLRITGQLIEAETGHHIWADRFHGELDDVFALQDQITAKVVAAIEPRLGSAEFDRSRLKPTESLTAYDLYRTRSRISMSSLNRAARRRIVLRALAD